MTDEISVETSRPCRRLTSVVFNRHHEAIVLSWPHQQTDPGLDLSEDIRDEF